MTYNPAKHVTVFLNGLVMTCSEENHGEQGEMEPFKIGMIPC